MKDSIKIIGGVLGILAAFISLNWFFYSIQGIQRWDYFLGNASLIAVSMFVYVFNEIQKIKDKLNLK